MTTSTPQTLVPAAAVAPRPSRDAALDGMRALAAIAVLGTHVGDAVGNQGARVDVPFLGSFRTGFATQELNLGVEVFFVISAFLVYRPFVQAHLGLRSEPSGLGFLVRRFWRIYPAYWVALYVIVAGSALHTLPTAGVFTAHTLLVQGWSGRFLTSSYGLRQAWTLSVEVCFYVLVPVWAVAMRAAGRRIGARRAELGGALALVAGGHLTSLLLEYHHPSVFPPVLPHLGVFAWGVLFAVVDAADLPVRRALAFSTAWWAAAGLVFVVWVQRSHIDPLRPFTLTAIDQFTQRAVHGLVAALLIAPIALAPDRGGGRRILTWRPLAFIGITSYGFYLWHYWMLELLHDHVLGGHAHELLTLFVASGVLTTACGALSWYAIERPAIRWSYRSRRPR